MKNILPLLVLMVVAIQSCCKKAVAPPCIWTTIEHYKNDPDWHVSKVDEYVFQGRIVYAFVDDPGIIADGGIQVKDEHCKPLCFIGGIAALTTCKGEKFSETAVYRRTIWKR